MRSNSMLQNKTEILLSQVAKLFIVLIETMFIVGLAVLVLSSDNKQPSTPHKYSDSSQTKSDETTKSSDIVSEPVTARTNAQNNFMDASRDIFNNITDEEDKKAIEDYLVMMRDINPYIWDTVAQQLEEQGYLNKEVGEVLEICLKATATINKDVKTRIDAFGSVMKKYLPQGSESVELKSMLYGNGENVESQQEEDMWN
jgi:hypothetical protein